MSRITWGAAGQHFYETGIDRGVLYVEGNVGVPWNGLISVDEKPVGGAVTSYYVDGQKFANDTSSEEFAGTLQAYTYPDEFIPCDGLSQVSESLGLFATSQPRKPFSMTYRTLVGNEIENTGLGYKIHLLYNILAEPTDRNNATINDSADPLSFSWELTALPPAMSGLKPTAHFVVDTRVANHMAVTDLETYLYGSDSAIPSMPSYDELIAIFSADATLKVVDNGDGTWTATTAQDGIITMIDGDYNWSQAVFDDFSDSIIDTTKWVVSGVGVTESNSLLNIPDGTSYPKVIGHTQFDISTGIIAARYYPSGDPVTTPAGQQTNFHIGISDATSAQAAIKAWCTGGVLAPIASGTVTSVTIVSGESESFFQDWTSGDWLGIGNIDPSGVIYVYKSSDGQVWTKIASFTYVGTIDTTAANLLIYTGHGTGTSTYVSSIGDASTFTETYLQDAFSITWDSAVLNADGVSYTLSSL